MAKKRKVVTKSKNQATKKKSLRAKKAAAARPVRKTKPQRSSRRALEPSSGSASSSLDPKRQGRLQVRDPRDRLRERIGDLQGISLEDRADSESVGELLEEGQTREAEAVQAIEDAPDADQGEVRTRQVPEDDVPEEYLDQD
jgi:hypothetical protein